MEIERALQQLELLQKKLYAYRCADSSLYLDAVTTAPSDTSEGRGVAMSILAGESQKLMTSPETKALLDELSARAGELDLVHRREVEELRRSCEQLTRIPADEYMAYKELCNRADDVWHKAKTQDDFALFCPVLQELVDYNRRFAGYYDASKAPYDALLNEYERGVDRKMLDSFFATLREGLVPLIHKIGEKPQIDDSFLHQEYPVTQQKAFADYLMEVMGLDRSHCGLGETEHPFTLEFNNKDVRITTNYDEYNVASSMYSVLHVMVRYEIEKQLIGGTLEAKDVPAVWAKLYKEYLGIEVPNDRDGCLQDSHWSGGAFGYFPSYALGSAYGAQMLRRMEQDVDVWGAAAKGDLTPITAWLREKVHQYGGLMEPADVVKNACGDFSAEDYIQYLTRKYTELYGL